MKELMNKIPRATTKPENVTALKTVFSCNTSETVCFPPIYACSGVCKLCVNYEQQSK